MFSNAVFTTCDHNLLPSEVFRLSCAFKQYLLFVVSEQAGSSITALLLEDPVREIPVVVIDEFDVRGYHFYNHQPNIDETIRVYPDDDPMSLIHDRYDIAAKTVGTGLKIGNVPKFMSKFTYYFLRHGGVAHGTVLGERQYSWDLQQGGLQIPTL